MVHISLDAVVVAVRDEQPMVLTLSNTPPTLPSAPLPDDAVTLDRALRSWVHSRTGLDVGYVEQLYTFGDLDRTGPGERHLSIAYLALIPDVTPAEGSSWIGWYELYPWEDHREGTPAVLDDLILPEVDRWVSQAPPHEADERALRAEIVFGLGGPPFDGVRALERYELLYEVGLLEESPESSRSIVVASEPMGLDHRRIVATAIARLRGKLTYRPVVFELLPERFTLRQLQRLVEALSGVRLHQQNFRRLVEGGGLVDGTGQTVSTGGRPAELFRFRTEVLRERPAPGLGRPRQTS